jgi:glycosyltransferase involved in cell wall biosynthesis
MTPDTLIIITARDEAERLGATLDALAAAFPGAALWVGDDGSRDGTAQVARARGATVVRSERSLGKGATATLAVRGALSGSGEARASLAGSGEARASLAPSEETLVVLCDGDLGASAGSLAGLLVPLRQGEADLSVAVFARRAGGGVGLAVGFARWAIARRCGLRLRAPISGQRALRVGVLRAVLPFAEGFGMEMAMTIDAARAGYRVREVPLELEHRATGRTLAGFLHRGRQLVDFVRVYVGRR